MNILQRRMASQGILNDTQTTLADYLMSIAQISVEDAGVIYIELSSIRGNFMANIILRMIENYHFLPDMAQKLKNKQALVESVIANEQLEPSITLSIKDVYVFSESVYDSPDEWQYVELYGVTVTSC